MKVLEVGSDSIHFTGFLKDMGDRFSWNALSEEPLEDIDPKKVEQISFRNLKPWVIRKNLRILRNYIKAFNPDVIHVHQVNRLAYFTTKVANALRIPVVTTAWGSDVLIVPKRNRFSRYLVATTLKRSEFVTADSNEMIEAMRTICPGGKYVWLQYGIRPVESKPKENTIYSNRLHKDLYRIGQIVTYFADFHAKHPDWNLVVAGSGTNTDHLKKQVNDLGLSKVVRFDGWLGSEENRANYANAKMYISIPESDGTAVSLLEAMSAGCVPVVSNLAVSREWIRDGINGVIEKPGQNPLEEALQVNAETCAELNKKRILESATRDRCLEEFYQLYTDAKRS